MSYRKNLNNWTVCYVVGLFFQYGHEIFVFFLSRKGEWGLCFCCVFCPLSREGNSGLHSTPSNYSSFYGSTLLPRLSTFTVLHLPQASF